MKRCWIVVLLILVMVGCGEEEPEPVELGEINGLKILVIGDSMFDSNVDDEQSIAHHLGRTLDTEVVDRSIGGTYFTGNDEGDDIREQYVSAEWDYLVMDGGANDLNEQCGCDACSAELDEMISADSTSGALPEFVNERLEDDIQVIFSGYYVVPPTAPEFTNCIDIITTYKERVQAFAEQTDGMWFVDMADVIEPSNLELYQEDQIHPSFEGSRLIGEQLGETISELEGER